MPLFDGDNPAHWEAHYSWATRDGMDPVPAHGRWADLVARGITSTDRVLIGGAGRGELVQAAHLAGFPLCWGIDGSSILGNGRFTLANGVLMVDRPMQGGGGTLARLRSVTGDDEFDWVITEDVVSCYDPTDPELAQILAACETVLTGTDLSRIVHIVSCDWSPDFADAPGYSQSIEEWATLAPAHAWMRI